MSQDQDYVLGNDALELARLRRQHELWKEESLKIWRTAGFGTGNQLLDLGCGPGFTSRDLARWIGPRGSVTAIDVSETFLKYLAAQPTEIQQAPIETKNARLESLDLEKKDFDGAFCRWLMIFVPDPEGAIRAVHNHLKKGGRFALQEYVAYDTMTLCPSRDSMPAIVDAIFKSWRDQGGDPNRGKVLPSLLEKNEFRVLSIEPVIRAIRPGDSLWDWPNDFYTSYLPRLIANQYITQAQADRFLKDWKDARNTPGHFLLSPTLVNIIAEKI